MTEFRAGFVSFVGRPNVGKSTLMNALVGQQIAITSDKPQTTRRIIRGIVHQDSGQLVIVDTPGLHRPRTLLGQRLNDQVSETIAEVDLIAMCFPADEPIGPGDKYINKQLDSYPKAKKVAVVTKTDRGNRVSIAERLSQVAELREWDLVVPVSAKSGQQIGVLADELISLMPISPKLYPDETTTEDDFEIRVAEIIRSCILTRVSDELPHSVAVTIDEYELDEGTDFARIFASIFVERISQKGIIIGKKGAMLSTIGKAARAQIESILGYESYLNLRVRVAQDWQRDPKQLGKLGF